MSAAVPARVAEYAADLTGPHGYVLGIDPLPNRIALAAGRARANLEYRIGSADELHGLEDESFDAVYLNAVLHWLPDKEGPLRQIRRLLKPSGRLGLWTIAKEHPSRVRIAKDKVFARARYSGVVHPQAGGPQPLNVAELCTLLETVGLRLESIELVDGETTLPSAEAAIDFIEASSFGNFLGHLAPDLRAAARDEIREELQSESTPEGLPLGGKSMVAVASRP